MPMLSSTSSACKLKASHTSSLHLAKHCITIPCEFASEQQIGGRSGWVIAYAQEQDRRIWLHDNAGPAQDKGMVLRYALDIEL